jgi:hypothetical protein
MMLAAALASVAFAAGRILVVIFLAAADASPRHLRTLPWNGVKPLVNGQRVDRVQDPRRWQRLFWQTALWELGAGVGFVRWATLCGDGYRDGFAPHTDW